MINQDGGREEVGGPRGLEEHLSVCAPVVGVGFWVLGIGFWEFRDSGFQGPGVGFSGLGVQGFGGSEVQELRNSRRWD